MSKPRLEQYRDEVAAAISSLDRAAGNYARLRGIAASTDTDPPSQVPIKLSLDVDIGGVVVPLPVTSPDEREALLTRALNASAAAIDQQWVAIAAAAAKAQAHIAEAKQAAEATP